jgi:hypothetical protein
LHSRLAQNVAYEPGSVPAHERYDPEIVCQKAQSPFVGGCIAIILVLSCLHLKPKYLFGKKVAEWAKEGIWDMAWKGMKNLN